MTKCDIGREFTQLQLQKVREKYALISISDTDFFDKIEIIGRTKMHEWVRVCIYQQFGYTATPLNELYKLIYTTFLLEQADTEYTIDTLEQMYEEYELAVLPIPNMSYTEFQENVAKCTECITATEYCIHHRLIYEYLDFANT